MGRVAAGGRKVWTQHRENRLYLVDGGSQYSRRRVRCRNGAGRAFPRVSGLFQLPQESVGQEGAGGQLCLYLPEPYRRQAGIAPSDGRLPADAAGLHAGAGLPGYGGTCGLADRSAPSQGHLFRRGGAVLLQHARAARQDPIPLPVQCQH